MSRLTIVMKARWSLARVRPVPSRFGLHDYGHQHPMVTASSL